jgi:maltose alpha-D-glucosyltransferase / alpha-amylase
MWYRRAIIYSLDVKGFCDSDGNGTGDLKGVISKLDYIASLGVNCVWLLPFFPSPKLDNGYDISDYYGVDPLLGSSGDFVQLIDDAAERGIRIIIDLIINHTSTEHPWFKEACSSRDARYRNFYIWDDDPDTDSKIEDSEKSIWEYSPETKSYYLHEYYEHQPDLNLANPEVIDEILKIMEYWIRLGVSGFRIDAAHSVTSTVDVENIDFGNLHTLFDKMNALLKKIKPDAILLGEADVKEKELKRYFIGEDGEPRMHMLFSFMSNRYSFVAAARKEGTPLYYPLELSDDIRTANWLNFIRHHDELNLKMLKKEDREKVWAEFAPEEDMRIYGHGIRRRLASMLKNDKARMKMFYAIVFGLPGIPLLNFGEEIGMGEDLSLKERESVRTPMQWTSGKNGGFSSAPAPKLYRPVINKGEFGFKKVNVADQQRDPDSFLNYMSRLVRMRLQWPIIAEGRLYLLKADKKEAAGWCFELAGTLLVLVYNLSDREITVKFSSDVQPAFLSPLFEDEGYDEPASLDKMRLHPYGFRWMQSFTGIKE